MEDSGKKYKIFIDGTFIDASSKEVIDVINPATSELFGQVPSCSPEDVKKAICSCKAAQEKWRKTPAFERGNYLKKIAKEINNNVDILALTIAKEQGKTLKQARGETLCAAELLEYHAEWARRIEGEIIPSDDENENILLYREPIGVVACILPWNFPLYVLARKLGPALITGNTVVLKPSSDTPCSALEFAKILEKIELPKGVVNVITGKGSVTGKEISENPNVGFVTVTGSVSTGQKIMQSCATNITKVSLELGGKAPAIIMDDADVDLAVAAITGSRVSNAGQVCSCVERVYVQKGVAELFLKKITTAMEAVTYGNGVEKPDSVMGCLINHEAVNTVHAMVKKAIEQGAKLLTGGEIPKIRGAFYPPTVLANCSNQMEIMREEIFGPVLPIMVFETVDQALELANDCKFGLTSTLYTKNYNTVLKFSNDIQFGELYINRKQSEAYQGFHAGWKQSGIGGDDGKHGMEEYLKTRVVYMKY
ncbi:aldehyde dehydrogenase [bacterium]|nr:aldehyde dehydrogenase [bacterium]